MSRNTEKILRKLKRLSSQEDESLEAEALSYFKGPILFDKEDILPPIREGGVSDYGK